MLVYSNFDFELRRKVLFGLQICIYTQTNISTFKNIYFENKNSKCTPILLKHYIRLYEIANRQYIKIKTRFAMLIY